MEAFLQLDDEVIVHAIFVINANANKEFCFCKRPISVFDIMVDFRLFSSKLSTVFLTKLFVRNVRFISFYITKIICS